MAETFPRAGVIGDPVKHSRSPIIHNFWLEQYSLVGSYEAVHVPAAEGSHFFSHFAQSGMTGCNVTIPHKETAFQAVAERTSRAESIGAVNTIWLEDGKLFGDNTDAYGFAANMDQQLPAWTDGDQAVVIGAGGAARAVLYALQERGFKKIILVNRTAQRAHQLAAKFGSNIVVKPFDTMAEQFAGTSLIVNTTSLGMEGADSFPFDMSMADQSTIVADLVYTPLETPLLREARRHGLGTVDGLGMLLHQAVPGFEKWFGTKPTVTSSLRKCVMDALELKENS